MIKKNFYAHCKRECSVRSILAPLNSEGEIDTEQIDVENLRTVGDLHKLECFNLCQSIQCNDECADDIKHRDHCSLVNYKKTYFTNLVAEFNNCKEAKKSTTSQTTTTTRSIDTTTGNTSKISTTTVDHVVDHTPKKSTPNQQTTTISLFDSGSSQTNPAVDSIRTTTSLLSSSRTTQLTTTESVTTKSHYETTAVATSKVAQDTLVSSTEEYISDGTYSPRQSTTGLTDNHISTETSPLVEISTHSAFTSTESTTTSPVDVTTTMPLGLSTMAPLTTELTTAVLTTKFPVKSTSTKMTTFDHSTTSSMIELITTEAEIETSFHESTTDVFTTNMVSSEAPNNSITTELISRRPEKTFTINQPISTRLQSTTDSQNILPVQLSTSNSEVSTTDAKTTIITQVTTEPETEVPFYKSTTDVFTTDKEVRSSPEVLLFTSTTAKFPVESTTMDMTTSAHSTFTSTPEVTTTEAEIEMPFYESTTDVFTTLELLFPESTTAAPFETKADVPFSESTFADFTTDTISSLADAKTQSLSTIKETTGPLIETTTESSLTTARLFTSNQAASVDFTTENLDTTSTGHEQTSFSIETATNPFTTSDDSENLVTASTTEKFTSTKLDETTAASLSVEITTSEFSTAEVLLTTALVSTSSSHHEEFTAQQLTFDIITTPSSTLLIESTTITDEDLQFPTESTESVLTAESSQVTAAATSEVYTSQASSVAELSTALPTQSTNVFIESTSDSTSIPQSSFTSIQTETSTPGGTTHSGLEEETTRDQFLSTDKHDITTTDNNIMEMSTRGHEVETTTETLTTEVIEEPTSTKFSSTYEAKKTTQYATNTVSTPEIETSAFPILTTVIDTTPEKRTAKWTVTESVTTNDMTTTEQVSEPNNSITTEPISETTSTINQPITTQMQSTTDSQSPVPVKSTTINSEVSTTAAKIMIMQPTTKQLPTTQETLTTDEEETTTRRVMKSTVTTDPMTSVHTSTAELNFETSTTLQLSTSKTSTQKQSTFRSEVIDPATRANGDTTTTISTIESLDTGTEQLQESTTTDATTARETTIIGSLDQNMSGTEITIPEGNRTSTTVSYQNETSATLVNTSTTKPDLKTTTVFPTTTTNSTSKNQNFQSLDNIVASFFLNKNVESFNLDADFEEQLQSELVQKEEVRSITRVQSNQDILTGKVRQSQRETSNSLFVKLFKVEVETANKKIPTVISHVKRKLEEANIKCTRSRLREKTVDRDRNSNLHIFNLVNTLHKPSSANCCKECSNEVAYEWDEFSMFKTLSCLTNCGV